MITVVCFLWRRSSDPARYDASHVNTLRNALRRYLPVPHDMVCVTNDAAGLHRDIRIVPMTQELVDRSVKRFLKLMLFRRDAADLFGSNRLLCMDLDVTPIADMSPLVGRSEDFVIWRDPMFGREAYSAGYLYNSSMILTDAGCRPQVYERMGGIGLAAAQDEIRKVKGVGSDQAWIGAVLGRNEAVWTQDDGVLGYKHDILPVDPTGHSWPANARLIVSHGRPKPWELDTDHPLRIAYERNTEQRAVAA